MRSNPSRQQVRKTRDDEGGASRAIPPNSLTTSPSAPSRLSSLLSIEQEVIRASFASPAPRSHSSSPSTVATSTSRLRRPLLVRPLLKPWISRTSPLLQVRVSQPGPGPSLSLSLSSCLLLATSRPPVWLNIGSSRSSLLHSLLLPSSPSRRILKLPNSFIPAQSATRRVQGANFVQPLHLAALSLFDAQLLSTS